MEEKERYLNTAAERGDIFFFEHDPVIECCTIEKNERGAYKVKERLKILDLII